jgi:hypothetical protein
MFGELVWIIPGTAILLLLISPVVLATRFLLDEAHGRRRRDEDDDAVRTPVRPLHECRKCGSGDVMRVRRTDRERLIALFSRRQAAYLCRSCGERFRDRPSAESDRRVA